MVAGTAPAARRVGHLLAEDHERAAEFFGACRRRGAQGSNTDFLICAAADRHGCSILTTDRDFGIFAAHLPVTPELPLERPDEDG